MSTVAKPQVLVFQEFQLVPTEITEPLRAHISGPNAILHRYDEPTEKDDINIGAYDRLNDACYPWPDRQAGSLVDEDSVHLFVDNACLLYHSDLIGDATGDRSTVAPVAGRTNWVRSPTVNYKTNGSYPHSTLFNDRDVQIGDKVYIRGVDDNEDCTEYEVNTTVTGFAADAVDAVINDCAPDINNTATTPASFAVIKTAGPDNCVTVEEGPTNAYDGLPSGEICEVYTVAVVASSVSGCNAARLRITTASGTDNQEEVTAEAIGDEQAIGTRGLKVIFNGGSASSCSADAVDDSVAVDELVVGQKWQITVCDTFEKVCCEASGDYTGPDDDTYVIEVTKGGTYAQLPEVSVTTVKGLDFSGPTTVTANGVAVPIGSYALEITFVDCFGSSSSSSGTGVTAGDSAVAGLRKGDKFYITVASGQNGPIRTLILANDLPVEILDASDLDLRLFIAKDEDFEVSRPRVSHPPLVNWSYETTQICVEAGVTAFDSTWTLNGTEQPLTLWSGTMYAEYREWVTDLIGTVGAINDPAALDEIPGQLDPDNILKWGIYRALQNSGGTLVRYTAVADPDILDSWQNVLERVDGRDDLYNFVPLTTDTEIHNLFEAQVNSESSATEGNWKAMFVPTVLTTSKMVVGKSSANAQLLNPTSTDGELVLAILDDNPQATGVQYTRLRVTGGNAGFIAHGVASGDIVRFLYTVDAFGATSYNEFVVDTVLSEDALLLLSGHTSGITIAQKIEIHHSLSKDEQITDLIGQAQAFSNRRVCAVFPDIVGTAGLTQQGYHLCAALAGLRSGAVPHQGLTNLEVSGFDDLASRTRDYFSDSQLDTLANGGVWIVTEDRDGTPVTRHALTTDMTDLNRREEMIRANVDSISYLFLRRLRPYIGRTNVTPALLGTLRSLIVRLFKYLGTSGFTSELGAQLISGSIRTLQQHPLAADRVEIILDLVVPAPTNNIELHLVV